MPIDTFDITVAQRDQVLATDESHFCDLKAIEIAPGKLTRSISAFANADGGELYIGVSEDKARGQRSWRGFATTEAANGHLQILEKLFPLGGGFQYRFLRCACEVGLLLHVEIQKTADIKKASDETAYLRRGAQNLPQSTAEELHRLELNKGITSYESQTVRAPVDAIANSMSILEFTLRVVPTREPREWLQQQALIRDGLPTVAGVLLFADTPQAYLPKSGIKIYRYNTREAEGTRDVLAFDPITIEGDAYDLIKGAVERTAQIAEETPVMRVGGLEKIPYPKETLHEIITNAVLHRDYSVNDDVHVKIFDNRIEVQSPGTLPAHVTVQNILKERFARNPQIVRVINKFPNPPNKDIGEGLNTAFAAMRKLKLKDPVVTQEGNAVVVNVRHERLAKPEEIIMEYLKDHTEINNSKARELCHIGSENVVKNIFIRLMKREMIEKIPEKSGNKTAYRLPTKKKKGR